MVEDAHGVDGDGPNKKPTNAARDTLCVLEYAKSYSITVSHSVVLGIDRTLTLDTSRCDLPCSAVLIFFLCEEGVVVGKDNKNNNNIFFVIDRCAIVINYSNHSLSV